MNSASTSRLFSSLVIVSALWAGSADAQTRYYARERLVGVPVTSTSTAPPEGTATPPAVQYGTWSVSADYVQTEACQTTTNSSTSKRLAVCSTSTCDPATKPVEPMMQTGCSMKCSPSNAIVNTAVNQVYNATTVRASAMPASATTPTLKLEAAVAYCNAYVPDVNFRAAACYSTSSQIVAVLTSGKALDYSTRTLTGAFFMTCPSK